MEGGGLIGVAPPIKLERGPPVGGPVNRLLLNFVIIMLNIIGFKMFMLYTLFLN